MAETYVVIEMQTSESTAVLATSYTDINVAMQKFYTVLAAAAVSKVPIHTALLVTNKGLVLKAEHFKHETEVEE